jgi:hypothetical protein
LPPPNKEPAAVIHVNSQANPIHLVKIVLAEIAETSLAVLS